MSEASHQKEKDIVNVNVFHKSIDVEMSSHNNTISGKEDGEKFMLIEVDDSIRGQNLKQIEMVEHFDEVSASSCEDKYEEYVTSVSDDDTHLITKIKHIENPLKEDNDPRLLVEHVSNLINNHPSIIKESKREPSEFTQYDTAEEFGYVSPLNSGDQFRENSDKGSDIEQCSSLDDKCEEEPHMNQRNIVEATDQNLISVHESDNSNSTTNEISPNINCTQYDAGHEFEGNVLDTHDGSIIDADDGIVDADEDNLLDADEDNLLDADEDNLVDADEDNLVDADENNSIDDEDNLIDSDEDNLVDADEDNLVDADEKNIIDDEDNFNDSDENLVDADKNDIVDANEVNLVNADEDNFVYANEDSVINADEGNLVDACEENVLDADEDNFVDPNDDSLEKADKKNSVNANEDNLVKAEENKFVAANKNSLVEADEAAKLNNQNDVTLEKQEVVELESHKDSTLSTHNNGTLNAPVFVKSDDGHTGHIINVVDNDNSLERDNVPAINSHVDTNLDIHEQNKTENMQEDEDSALVTHDDNEQFSKSDFSNHDSHINSENEVTQTISQKEKTLKIPTNENISNSSADNNDIVMNSDIVEEVDNTSVSETENHEQVDQYGTKISDDSHMISDNREDELSAVEREMQELHKHVPNSIAENPEILLESLTKQSKCSEYEITEDFDDFNISNGHDQFQSTSPNISGQSQIMKRDHHKKNKDNIRHSKAKNVKDTSSSHDFSSTQNKTNRAADEMVSGKSDVKQPVQLSNMEKIKRKIEEIMENSKIEEDAAIAELQKIKKEKTEILIKISEEMQKKKIRIMNQKLIL